MRTLGNIAWILLGGIWTALGWALAGIVFYISIVGIWEAAFYALAGLLLCITVVGAPFGLQLLKMAQLSLLPFGAKVLG